MESTRRKYLEGVVAAAGVTGMITVTPTGEARGQGPPEDVPPRNGKSVMGLTVDPIEQVQVGIIGLGNRGSGQASQLASMYPDKLEITAICDLVEDRVEEKASELQGEGMDPATYSAGIAEDEWGEVKEVNVDEMPDSGWREVAQRDDIDIVFIYTNHQAHAPMGVYVMEQGKHAAIEIPVATTIKECWDLVKTAEKHQKLCTILENDTYDEQAMWLKNMVHQGIFGELSYASGGYVHHQVGSFLHDYGPPNNWRGRMYYTKSGDMYPTHGLGPLAWYMNILRGDRFEYIVSQESPATRFPQYAENELDPDHEFYGKTDWESGDTTRSLIKTNKGRSIKLQLDSATTRPYTRFNELAGSDAWHHGSIRDFLGEGSMLADDNADDSDTRSQGLAEVLTEEAHEEYQNEYRHPFWEEDTQEGLSNKFNTSVGSDFLQNYRIIDALNKGRPLDMDVYDAVTWSAVRPLSRISIEHGGKPVKFPDFTRGDWEKDRELMVMEYDNIEVND